MKKLPFEAIKGMRLTLITISDWMAHNMRSEIEITGVQADIVTFKQRGKRKEYYFEMKPDAIVLDGWDLPIKCDSDCPGGFCGNACYNLVADNPSALKKILDSSLNPLSADTKAKVFFISDEQFDARDIHNGKLLYPEIETYHAVINRFKNRTGMVNAS